MAPPANDDFANAIALAAGGGTRSGDTTLDATKETGESVHWFGNTDQQSVWYSFTPSVSGRYRFMVTFKDTPVIWGDTRQGSVALYSGSAVNALTKLVGINNSQTSPSIDVVGVVADLASGTTYHLMVAASLFSGETVNDHVFEFDLEWSGPLPDDNPTNDSIATAEDLGTDPADGAYPGSTHGAADTDWGDPLVWYKFETTSAESQRIQVVRSGDYPEYYPYWELYEVTNDPPTTFSDLNFVDSGGDNNLPIADNTVSLAGSTKYVILVTTFWANKSSDTFDLVFGDLPEPPTAPPNDNRDDVLSEGPYDLAQSEWGDWFAYPHAKKIVGTTIEATAEVGDPTIAGFAATRNVWYRFQMSGSFSTPNRTVKVWVESAVDCVLGIFEIENFPPAIVLIDEDDDSGTGDQPEITFVPDSTKEYYFVVDSKTEGNFVLKYQVVTDTPAPANDDFDDAVVISSLPFNVAGSTVNASAEPGEREAEALGTGPTDSVWYKWVADRTGTINVKAICETGNDDGYIYIDVWKGTTLDNLVREPVPDGLRGFFGIGDSPEEIAAQSFPVAVTNGETVYFRVQTFSGGSEDFTIYIDVDAVYIDIQPSGSEEFHGTMLDDATVYIDLQVGGSELQTHEISDAATVYVNISFMGGECYSTFSSVMMDSDAEWRWQSTADTRWRSSAEWRWSAGEIQIEGVNC